MNTNLTTIINTQRRTDIIPVDKKTFVITPTQMNLPIVYATVDEENKKIYVSEEDLSKKELLREVFNEDSEFSSGIQKFSSNDEVLLKLIEQDPLILSELYVLFEEQHNVDSKKLWKLVKLLLSEFSIDIIITKLVSARLEELEALIIEKDYVNIRTRFMEL